MAEIVEVFEDGAENVKKFVKKNPLIVAGLGVGAVALYVLWVKSRESAVDTTAYEAIGYGGYPTVGGGGSSADSGEYYDSDSYYEEIIRENQSQTNTLLEQITVENNATLAEMESTIGYLKEKVISSEEKSAEYETQIKRQNAVSQMRANSELYNTITDRATKDALHAENLAIAEEMGWTFDPSTGNYFEGNSVVYTTAKQQSGQNTAYVGSKVSTAPTGSFVNNKTYNQSVIDSVLKASAKGGYVAGVDYSALYEESAKNGADSATLKAIQTGRQNKVNSQYGGVDPNPTSKVATALYQKDGKTYTTASDGKPIEVTKKAEVSGARTSQTKVSLARDTSRAGQTVTANGWTTTYNDKGYVVKQVKSTYKAK